MTFSNKVLLRIGVSIAVTFALTWVLWPLIQGRSATALAVGCGVATSSLLEDRMAGHELHWRGAAVSAGTCALLAFVALVWLTP